MPAAIIAAVGAKVLGGVKSHFDLNKNCISRGVTVKCGSRQADAIAAGYGSDAAAIRRFLADEAHAVEGWGPLADSFIGPHAPTVAAINNANSPSLVAPGRNVGLGGTIDAFTQTAIGSKDCPYCGTIGIVIGLLVLSIIIFLIARK